jgi:hypothetical protein
MTSHWCVVVVASLKKQAMQLLESDSNVMQGLKAYCIDMTSGSYKSAEVCLLVLMQVDPKVALQY